MRSLDAAEQQADYIKRFPSSFRRADLLDCVCNNRRNVVAELFVDLKTSEGWLWIAGGRGHGQPYPPRAVKWPDGGLEQVANCPKCRQAWLLVPDEKGWDCRKIGAPTWSVIRADEDVR